MIKLPLNQVNNCGYNKAKTEKRITHKGKRFTKTLKKIDLINDTQLRTGGLIFAILGFVIIYYVQS